MNWVVFAMLRRSPFTAPAGLKRRPRWMGLAAALAAGAVLVAALWVTRADAPPPFTHIWVIVMENRDYSRVIGSPDSPYVNQLAATYGLATNYYAVTHGSQPNYVALFSGAQYGVTGGSTPNLNESNLADQIEASHRTWKVFAENFPGNCFNGVTASGGRDGPGTYVRRHVPAIAFRDIRNSASRCANVTDFSHFDPTAANFELIVPNLIDDGHDGTSQQADAFLRRFVPRITGSSAWNDSGVLLIVWDEGKETGDNHVPALVISPLVGRGFRSAVPHDHYSLLRTIEEAWSLPCLVNACQANTLAEFFGEGSGPSIVSPAATASRP